MILPLLFALLTGITAWMTSTGVARAESSMGGPITRSEVIARAQDWLNRSPRLVYNSTRAASTLVSDVDGAHRYGPDCSGMVSMAWHIDVGSIGGRNTNSLDDSDISIPIDLSELKAGDLLDDTIDGHAVLFNAWDPDGVHFSYFSFGGNPMGFYTGGSFAPGTTISTHPSGNYRAYRYRNIIDDGPVAGSDDSVVMLNDFTGDGKRLGSRWRVDDTIDGHAVLFKGRHGRPVRQRQPADVEVER